MKPITISPVSLVLGALLAFGLFLVMGQAPVQPVPVLRVEYGPQPRDMVAIREGTPFIVPSGRRFVLTAFGASQNACYTWNLYVNGSPEISRSLSLNGTGYAIEIRSLMDVPGGFVIQPGSTVEVTACGSGRAYGYLSEL